MIDLALLIVEYCELGWNLVYALVAFDALSSWNMV